MADNPKRCKSCGFRVRGKNHAEGDHHKGNRSGKKGR